jgi:Rad3-related DNA helicase
VKVLGVPIESPPAVANRVLSDLTAIARLARSAPAQVDRVLELGEEIVGIGRKMLRVAERLDDRVDAILALGERLDARAEAIMELGERLDARAEAIMLLGERLDGRAGELVEAGKEMRDAGQRVDRRGAEIVESATRVVDTGSELITVLPAFERALEMATPLEGAIDRFGRLVDRLPGGTPRRRAEGRAEAGGPGQSPEVDSAPAGAEADASDLRPGDDLSDSDRD